MYSPAYKRSLKDELEKDEDTDLPNQNKWTRFCEVVHTSNLIQNSLRHEGYSHARQDNDTSPKKGITLVTTAYYERRESIVPSVDVVPISINLCPCVWLQFLAPEMDPSSSCSGRIRFDSCSLYPQNEIDPSISSSVVLCVFVLLVYIVVPV